VSSSSLTALIVLVTLIHVAVFAVMIVIRVRRTESGSPTAGNAKATPCALCGEPASHWSYDGLDPDEQRDPHTGRSWSTDMAHYQPLCAAH
jgi:cell division protein FtsN